MSFDIHTVRTGDLFRFNNPKIKKLDSKYSYVSKTDGAHRTTTGFAVEGFSSRVGFANALVKKTFVGIRDKHNTFRFFLLDNFKPEVYGAGQEFSLSSTSPLEKVGRITDLRRFPEPIRKLAQELVITREEGSLAVEPNMLSKTGWENVSQIENRRMLRRVIAIEDEIDKFILSALYNIRCCCCNNFLKNKGTSFKKVTNENEEEIASSAAYSLFKHYGNNIPDNLTLFPKTLKCGYCLNNLIALSFTNNNQYKTAVFKA